MKKILFRKKELSVVVFFIFAVSLIFSATENVEQTESEKKEFVLHFSNDIPLLQPHVSFNADEAQFMTAVYEGLFVYDPYTCNPVLGLAESWEVNGTTWRFKIRKNAVFQNGDRITAQTFVDSWLNLLDPNYEYPYASLLDCVKGASDYRHGINNNPEDVFIKAEDDLTLVVTLNTPVQYFLKILCHHAFVPVHPSQLDASKKFVNTFEITNPKNAFVPIANGAFVVDNITKDEIRFIKNEKYWDKNSVGLDSIVIKMNMSAEEQSDAYNRGNIHWLKSFANLSEVVGYRSINYTPIFGTEYLFFNLIGDKLDDAKLRSALLLAIPYDELRDGYPLPATNLIFPLTGYPSVHGVNEFNIEKAIQIIKKLNLSKQQKTIKIKFPLTEYHKGIAKILKTAWEKLDFDVTADFVSINDYYAQLKTNDYNIATMTWIADFADPMGFLELFRPNTGLNESNWKSSEYENLILKANAEINQEKRYGLLAQAEQLLLDNSVVIPISYNLAINVINVSNLSGWYVVNPLDIHPFKFIKFITPEPLPGFVMK